MQNNQNIKTVIAEDVEIVGSVKCSGDIQLAGKLSGDLVSGAAAIITETATIKGNVSVNSTTVMGTINGNISAKDRIELKSSARVTGDIHSKRLTVEDGVTFVGKAEVTPSGPRPSGEAKAQDLPAAAEDEEAQLDADGRKGASIFGRR